ncbi:MAG: ribose ABC transporter permease [Algoriphagus sp. 32-45-6]|jgi:phospholipid N-methyltransferase|nr:MAG: ribose ABC transporter permease [Algoriphagus sp. 32-45-6]
MSKANLLMELYSNLGTTGAVTFSSKFLVNRFLSFTDFSNALVIVEFGGGDGSITQGIIDRMRPDANLYVFEINKAFCDTMRVQFPQANVHIINDSAENFLRYLKGNKADLILTSLPFTLIPKEVTDQILRESQHGLSEQGQFLQLCYNYRLKQLFLKYFPRVNANFILRNIPPAWVMICS